MSVGPVLGALRSATGPLHDALEARTQALSRLLCREGRAGYVAALYSAYAPLEAALEPWLIDEAGLDFAGRRKLSFLAEDLEALGRAAPPDADLTELHLSAPRALGLQYVLEGATLGARVLAREVRSAGGDLRGLSFFDCYGAEAGARFRAFCDVLEGRPDETDDIIAGAVLGFQIMDAALAPEGALQ